MSARGEITIRPIQPADDAAIAAIIRAVMPEFGAVGSGFAISDPEVDWMSRAYAAPRHAYFVVERDGVVRGGGGIAPLIGGAVGGLFDTLTVPVEPNDSSEFCLVTGRAGLAAEFFEAACRVVGVPNLDSRQVRAKPIHIDGLFVFPNGGGTGLHGAIFVG